MLKKLALVGFVVFVARAFSRSRALSGSPGGARTVSLPGHLTTDLNGDEHPDGKTRAEDHFRPDRHARVAEEDRESLRPATVDISQIRGAHRS